MGKTWWKIGSGHHFQCTVPKLSALPVVFSRKQAENLLSCYKNTELFHWDEIQLLDENFISKCDHNLLER